MRRTRPPASANQLGGQTQTITGEPGANVRVRVPDRAEYVLSGSARTNARRDILRLPAAEAYLLYRVGAAWAAASTSRKNLARAEASPVSTRRSSLA